MALLPPLEAGLAARVLRHLALPPPAPTRDWLDRLLQQYGRRVPWESASRIVRVGSVGRGAAPRLPEAFWEGTLADGSGGTCFESNAALAALLAAVGFDGMLTINDMHETRACHTALIVAAAEGRMVVDAGYPIYAALPLGEAPASRQSPWFRYDIQPTAPGRFRIENHPHPSPYVFDLRDEPVSPADYLAALRADYGVAGLFLDRVVLRRVVDEQVWRFASHDRPWHLECFTGGVKLAEPLGNAIEAAAVRLADHFGLPRALLATALATVSGDAD